MQIGRKHARHINANEYIRNSLKNETETFEEIKYCTSYGGNGLEGYLIICYLIRLIPYVFYSLTVIQYMYSFIYNLVINVIKS